MAIIIVILYSCAIAFITIDIDEYAPYFNGFLRKPIEIDKLYEALVNAIETT